MLHAVRLAGAPADPVPLGGPAAVRRVPAVPGRGGAGRRARSQVVAACTHPATEGLQVGTQAPEAVAVRRMMLEFLLARCPTSGVIRDLAADAGVTAIALRERRVVSRPDELCILCGLCVARLP